MSRPRVTFLMPVASHPRYIRRVKMLEAAGFHVTVAAVSRAYIRGESLEYPVTEIGSTRAGAYWSRLFSAPQVVRRIRATGSTDLIYAFEPEMGLYALLSRIAPRVVVEIGDVRDILMRRGPVPSGLRLLERWIALRVDRIITTSREFLTEYYGRCLGLPLDKGLVVENKIAATAAAGLRGRTPPPAGTSPGVIRIGWFGVLRCENTWTVLRDWAGRDPGARQVVIAGRPTPAGPSRDELNKAVGVRYLGEYESPSGLPELYGAVDVVCAAAPSFNPSGDWRWKRVNRFYEAGFFRRPVIASTGGADAAVVRVHRIGMDADFFDPPKAVAQLERIDIQQIREWSQNYDQVPLSTFVQDGDGASLGVEMLRLATNPTGDLPLTEGHPLREGLT